MKNIDIIYRNESGIAFYWKTSKQGTLKAQVIFRDMGFYFTLDQLKKFAYLSEETLVHQTCKDCPAPRDCRSLLLKTPLNDVDLAVSRQEVYQIQDLLDQTILRMEMQAFMQTALN